MMDIEGSQRQATFLYVPVSKNINKTTGYSMS